MESDSIIIKGAREHNLKNVNIELPRNKFIVITGVSGSGKSSLAFDTIYAEGQRRYVESLSAYARQFLGQMEKPDVDYIGGLSPAISIEQKTTHRNPRSTVGTITEVYDYLRLLFARCGTPHCHQCGKEVQGQSIDQIVDSILLLPEKTKLQVLAPIVRGRKGEYKKELERIKQNGFVRVRINGEIKNLDEEITIDKKKKHSIEVVVDRIIIKEGIRERLADSVETALALAEGLVTVLYQSESKSEDKDKKEEEKIYSEHLACIDCNISMPELQPRIFSFNSPHGACQECHGIGEKQEFDEDSVIPDKTLSIIDGAIAPIKDILSSKWYLLQFESLAKHYKFKLDIPVKDLDDDILDIILYGSGGEEINFTYISKNGRSTYKSKSPYEGIIPMLERRYRETHSDDQKDWYNKFMRSVPCQACNGNRLRPEALAVKIESKNIIDITQLSVKYAVEFFKNVPLTGQKLMIAEKILKEIQDRLGFLNNVGLGYLSLNRKAGTLSGGEMQRIRLATQIGSQLVGVLYVLDEPTIGLHQRDNQKLIDTLTHLKNLGNTLIVVEHDDQTILSSDYVVDLGPGAGVHGGTITAQGTPTELMKDKNSLTGKYLSGNHKILLESMERVDYEGKAISIKGCNLNNLKNVDVDIPLGKLIVVTGVSGSGKSTLVNESIYPALMNRVYKSKRKADGFKSLSGWEEIDKIINIDQSPIGRTPRSNPATYTGLFTPIRELFSSLPEAKIKGYKPGRFSFNVKGGRCEACSGDGTLKIEMHFLPDVYVTCDVCKGKRYNQETLEVRYKGKNIAEVLDLTITQAVEFFENIPSVYKKLKTLVEVGLGYIKLGQSATTLSGGEAQRVKLATELSKRSSGKTLYLLDEPTTGLHFDDVNKLIQVLNRFVEKGNTVLVIEHNLDVVKVADHIIDLGPEGGDEGGTIVVTGSPVDVSLCEKSHTGRFLKEILEKEKLSA